MSRFPSGHAKDNRFLGQGNKNDDEEFFPEGLKPNSAYEIHEPPFPNPSDMLVLKDPKGGPDAYVKHGYSLCAFHERKLISQGAPVGKTKEHFDVIRAEYVANAKQELLERKLAAANPDGLSSDQVEDHKKTLLAAEQRKKNKEIQAKYHQEAQAIAAYWASEREYNFGLSEQEINALEFQQQKDLYDRVIQANPGIELTPFGRE